MKKCAILGVLVLSFMCGCSQEYSSNPTTVKIIDGLPPSSSILFLGPLKVRPPYTDEPGGTLGGEVVRSSDGELEWRATGTGELEGYDRFISLPVPLVEAHTGPRNPGDPVQSFPTDMFMMQGQLYPGDPDFDLLRITAGTGFGMPSPGHTTLTQLPGGSWNVDSFFDITYRIDFVGAPGGPLAGMSGSTTDTTQLTANVTIEGDGEGGQDCYKVRCTENPQDSSFIDFSQNPIPPDFFGPGSDPFDGVIRLVGNPNPHVIDVRVRRCCSPSPIIGEEVVIPIEIVALNLTGGPPVIPVTYNGGIDPCELWRVSVGLSQQPSTGTMAVTTTHPNGGTFTAEFQVWPVITFTEVGNSLNVRVLPDPWPTIFSTPDPCNFWQNIQPIGDCGGNGFWAEAPIYTLANGFRRATLVLEPKHLGPPTGPHFGLDTYEQFKKAIEIGQVEAMTAGEWLAYYAQLLNYLVEGPPYQPNEYLEDTSAYAYDALDRCIRTDRAGVEPASAGMVLAGGDPCRCNEGGSYSIAASWNYLADPDLSNVAITVTVLPPPWINVVSLGMQDINGNIRAWYWNVAAAAGPGTLQWDVPTTININTSQTGLTAANPAATGYVNSPAFDITQVSQLNFDENGTWVSSLMVPPPGETIPRMWNYWYDLAVTPNHSIKTTDPIKWSQPALEYCPELEHCCPGVFKGWDEISVQEYRPLLADDWECKDDRPITDIHWWGSFVGWMEPELPVQRPIAFHFGIWTDTPKDPCQINKFSHPDRLIWEYYCYDYQWNFAGYDKDPRPLDTPGSTIATTAGIMTLASATSTVSVVQPTIYDSCFQFYQKLPPEAWFYQEPGPCSCCRRVYWLSISAIYPPYGMPLQYPWGWKTRPHYYNDDAVRIYRLQSGNWPPQPGDSWSYGVPVKYPPCTSWDLAFELTTNRECDPNEPQPPSADLNGDGIVNFDDLAILAEQWLTGSP